ncbi:hypothetical protein [Bacillus wiedmannii]|uniref:hypothetical protein n=1 Tax=Bacillus wiedmannii TaxID=1890302 RepID=UPI000BFD5102|nr:hypothetical protein [Bacillus wiedmannii]PHA01086.1 hypothetical protein COE63_17075 [Bacillus wiedmannii]
MKKWTYLFLILMGLFILSGCGLNEDEKRKKLKETENALEKQLQKSVDTLVADENLSNYLASVQYEKTEDSDSVNLYYNIVGNLNDTFDSLSRKEQYAFFEKINDMIKKNYKENYGNLNCDKDYHCIIWSIEFSTSTEKYSMLYEDTINEKKKILQVGDYSRYGSDGYLISDEKNITDTSNEESSSANLSTANGKDWVELDASQKSEIVTTVLSNLKGKGYTILEGTDWFVDALNAYYGDNATNSTEVTEAIVLAGFGGKVISAP